jgi:hypothetical protein
MNFRSPALSCDSCSTTSKVQWCEGCNRFMCVNFDNEIHSVSLPYLFELGHFGLRIKMEK